VSEFEEHGQDTEKGAEPEFSIGESKAIMPMLAAAAVAVVVILLSLTRAQAPLAPVGSAADRAFSPKDFPAIFAQEVPRPAATDGGEHGLYAVPPPPFSEGIYPCSSCHNSDLLAPNPVRRELTGMHDNIVLHHDEEHRWCLDCHDTNNRDQLHLASGAPVLFSESYQLCGQCHGTQYRDWRIGIHGKRTGDWSGSKEYLLCVHCHNPHSPRFSALEPLPPPIRPQYLLAQPAHPAARGSARLASDDKETLDGR
jgi:hypothetical protein